ncbi:MAG: STY0301 family protein [Telluria sp.]
MRPHTFLLLTLLAAGRSVTAAEQVIKCPASIDGAILKVDAPAGWKGHAQSRLLFQGATITSGPPEQMAIMRGEDIRKKSRVVKTVYDLSGGPAEYPNGKWVSCLYGRDGIVMLGKQLQEPVTRCSFTEHNSAARERDQEMHCE